MGVAAWVVGARRLWYNVRRFDLEKEKTMALPIRPTPILEGEDAIRLEKYMAESETHKEYSKPIVVDWDKIRSALKRIDERIKSKVVAALL